MCKRSPAQGRSTQRGDCRDSSWSCPMTFCGGWPSWAAAEIAVFCGQLDPTQNPAPPGSSGTTWWRAHVAVHVSDSRDRCRSSSRDTAEDVGVKKCRVGKMQGTFVAGDRGRRQKCTARGSSSAGPMGRRVSVVSMIRPKAECVRRDPWFAVRKVSVLMAGGMPKAERPD